jgi:hypothetical protein
LDDEMKCHAKVRKQVYLPNARVMTLTEAGAPLMQNVCINLFTEGHSNSLKWLKGLKNK